MNHHTHSPLAGCTIAFATFCFASIADAAIVVRFDPPVVNANVGDNITINVLADIPANQPLLGWGLFIRLSNDVVVRQPIMNGVLTGNATIGTGLPGADWYAAGNILQIGEPVTTNPSQRLAGLAFPNPIAGGTSLLMTLRFTATALGNSDIIAFDDRANGDNATGFALVPPKGFAEVIYVNGRINIPAPSAGVFAITSAFAFAARRRR